MKISNFSIKRPVFTIVTMFLVLILGAVSVFKIPLKLIPDINPPVAVVVTSYHGASPTEVVEKVTKPLEANLATLPGIKNVQTISQEGSNFTLLEFSWSTKIDDIQNEVLQRIDQTPIPDDAGKPRFLKFDPSQFPIIQLSLKTEGDKSSLRKLAESLTTELTKVEGVASVNVTGNIVEQISVQLDQEKLKQYQLSQADIVQVIQANNISLPGETVESDGKQLTTRILSQLHSPEDIQQLAIAVNPLDGTKLKIQDVADVSLLKKEENSITRTNEKPAVLLSVLQETDANTATVSKAFKKELTKLLDREEYKEINANILFDQGDYIQIAIGNIATSLIIGGALAMLVLFFFLRNIRTPLIVGVAIPYSVIVTFVLMYFANFALNIMTLGALALGIGMLVDNSIVVIENIYRHLSMGKSRVQAARDGAKEVGGAITASTLTTVAVFLPVVFITGLLGELFTEFALTISFSLFASLFVALTVIPMMASRLLKKPKGNMDAKRRRSKSMKMLEKSVRWSLRHRLTVLFFTLLLFVGGIFGLTKVGTQFLPSTDEGFFSIGVTLENGTALSETDKVIKKMEEVLQKEKDVDFFVSLVGSTQEDTFRGSGKANTAEIYIKMKALEERDRSIFQFVDEIQPQLEKEVNDVNEAAKLVFNVQATSGLSPQTLSFHVRDTNKQRLEASADKIFTALKDLEEVNELSTNQMDEVEEVQITIDRDKALAAGLVPAQIAMTVNDITRGVQASQVISEEAEVQSVFVAYDTAITRDLDKLKKILIKKPDGEYATLDEIAQIEIGKGPVQIQRINQQDAIQFTLKYSSDVNLGEISKIVDEKIAESDIANETEITFGGDRELLEDGLKDMTMAFILAIVLIYIVMAAQFESFKYPFVIMFTVPLMVIGVAIALTLTRIPLSISAIIGIIILAGIVVNNAIVIVDYINQRKRDGLDSLEAIVESVKDRARPILMTALTTILGLVPLAIGIGQGTEINQPMGVTVIGGLISSTFLTIYVIPVVYSFFDPETRRKKKKKRRKPQPIDL